MVTIANCLNLQEATQLKMLLESAGITAFIPDEASASVAPHHFLTESGVRVQVEEGRAEEARNLIESQKSEPS